MVTLIRNQVIDNLPSLQSGTMMGDVTLVFEDGKLLKALKVLLGLHSEYFANIFKSVDNCSDGLIIMNDFCYFTIKILLEYLYMGYATVSENNLVNFIKTTNQFKISSKGKMEVGLNDSDDNFDHFNFNISHSLNEKTSEVIKESLVINETETDIEKLNDNDIYQDKTSIEQNLSDIEQCESKGKEKIEELQFNEEFGKYPCNHCGKHFKKRKQLKRHKKTHEESKFQCEICANRFSDKRHLFIYDI